MRILHLLTSLDPTTGGPANVLARLAPVQAERGHDIEIVTADDPESLRDTATRLQDQNIRVTLGGPMSGPFAKGPRTRSAITESLARGRDLVHLHGLWQDTTHAGAVSARRNGTPYIVRPCGMLDPWSLRQGRLKKRIYLAVWGRRDLNEASALHFTTETERVLVEPLQLRPPGFIIPNGVDWSEFAHLPEPGRFRASRGYGDEPLVVFLSRVHPKKGIELLLDAFASARIEATTRLAIVGPGEANYIGALRERAESAGIGSRVDFVGMLSGSARIEALADADLFALTSFQENFGVVVIEALAAGTPTLISDQVNIYREVEAAEVGRATPCEVDAIRDGLERLLADRKALQTMGERGREWVHRTFQWTSIANQIDTMYEAVLRTRADGR
ncbi:MAG: glycosyltransferase [Phycisphaerales bacterium]